MNSKQEEEGFNLLFSSEVASSIQPYNITTQWDRNKENRTGKPKKKKEDKKNREVAINIQSTFTICYNCLL